MPRKSTNKPVTTKSLPQADKAAAPNLLNSLLSKAKAAPAKPAAKKKIKPVIHLTGKDADKFDSFTSSDAVAKVASGIQTSAKNDAASIVKPLYIRMCIESGYKPDTPIITTEKSKANYQVKHVNKLKLTPSPNGETLTVADQLRQLGFGDDVINEVQKVIKEKPQLGLKKFTDLQADEASPAQRAVAEKIMGLIQENLNEEELALVLETSIDTTVGENWKDLAVQIAVKVGGGNVDKGVEALTKLFTVISPQFVMAQMTYSGELKDAFARMQASPPPEKKTISHGQYEADCEGNKVTLFIVRPTGREELGVKQCENPGHAEMSARKWFRVPDALTEQLADFAASRK